MKPSNIPTSELIEKIKKCDLLGLSKGITLVESSLKKDRNQAEELLNNLPTTENNTIRIGITGIPGVGKSTFIEAFGEYLINVHSKKVAVLAIDPSSEQTKGSILGDKTRMEKLRNNPKAFIRPSASGKSIGGVANSTREALLLCEAAGYDIIIIETVGVGQSETAVKNMTDFFLLLILPGAGDELQGIKRGITEVADFIIINKADGNTITSANIAKINYENALHLLPLQKNTWQPKVFTCSSTKNVGIDTIWKSINHYYGMLYKTGEFKKKRNNQRKKWLDEILSTQIIEKFLTNPKIRKTLPIVEQKVIKGLISPSLAARELLKLLF